MFFSENLYLEADEVSEPITKEEVTDAIEEAAEEELETKIGEGKDFEIYAYDNLAILTEGYYNLRERMMNIEHIASLKEAEGLVSESEQIMSESVDGFIAGVKNFFEKLGTLIKNLFNRFVEFIMGLTVSVNQIKNINVANSWKQFASYHKKKDELKINVMSVKHKSIMSAPKFAASILAEATSCVLKVTNNFKSIKKSDKTIWTNDVPEGFVRKIEALSDGVEEYIVNAFAKRYEGTGKNPATVKGNAITKIPATLDQTMFTERVQYVIKYKEILNQVKSARDAANKVIKGGISSIESVKNPNANQKKYQGTFISQLRWWGSCSTAAFSKLTSVLSQYYRESLSIARRVAGGSLRKDNENKIKAMTEGFDYESYFSSAF